MLDGGAGVDRIFDFEAGVDVLEVTGTVADALANATDAVDAAGVNLAVITDASGIFVLRGYTAAETSAVAGDEGISPLGASLDGTGDAPAAVVDFGSGMALSLDDDADDDLGWGLDLVIVA